METSKDKDDIDNQLRMSILERLEQMEKRMEKVTATNQQQQNQNRPQTQSGSCFEQRIVGVCQRMMEGSRWSGGSEKLLHSVRHRGMTLLHLAAAQGYTQLIHTLIHWRNVNTDNLDLEQEVDPLNVDHFSCTPLMWACALGHQGAAELLYHWNSLALGIPDSLGRMPLAVARSRGHTQLVCCLEELHMQAAGTRDLTLDEGSQWSQSTNQSTLLASPLSVSPDTGVSSSSSPPSHCDLPPLSPCSNYSSGSASLGSPPSPPSVPPPLPMWGETHRDVDSMLSSGSGEPPFRTMYKPASFPSPPAGPQNTGHGHFQVDLLSYGENAENEDYLEDLQVDMATLAEQIVEATPERIKQEESPWGSESPLRERRDKSTMCDTLPWLATYLETLGKSRVPSPLRYRCACRTAPSSRSPPTPFPLSALALQRVRPPGSATWAEFLEASAGGCTDRDSALLTLSDGELRELYQAARLILTGFHRYKGRRLKEQQDRAAAIMQRCYRKYQQYALYKKMTQAAILIQSKFRSYYEQKKFQQSRRAAVLIQQYYRSYKKYERLKKGECGSGTLSTKESFLTKKQDQAAHKIMRFLRRCRHRIKELKQSKELERMQKRGLTT